MNGDDRLRQLFDAARKAKPDTARVEFGFETRPLARLRAERERSALWAAWAWRLTPAFGAIVVALALWNYVDPVAAGSDPYEVLTGDAEQVLAVMQEPQRKIRDATAQVRPAVGGILSVSNQKVRDLLHPEQQQKYDRLIDARRDRWLQGCRKPVADRSRSVPRTVRRG